MKKKTVFVRYLHGWYYEDASELESVYKELSSQTGATVHIDFLRTEHYYWF
jgi:hypothetical protein